MKRLDSGDPDYVGTLQQLDDVMGDIRSTLEKHKVFNDTLMFYTSDNGAHCNELVVSKTVISTKTVIITLRYNKHYTVQSWIWY